jgi:hypothetical protein
MRPANYIQERPASKEQEILEGRYKRLQEVEQTGAPRAGLGFMDRC